MNRKFLEAYLELERFKHVAWEVTEGGFRTFEI